jgi:hypothetical protein
MYARKMSATGMPISEQAPLFRIIGATKSEKEE